MVPTGGGPGLLLAVSVAGCWAQVFREKMTSRMVPVDDLGIVNAVKNVYRLRKRPTADRIRAIGEVWRPYRSIASWYLWRTLDNE